ncbi:hypothetical protein [Fibrella forsythiae]|uniref:Uncharacterized protein n=1 Tax=Fibrella forsythiae TaxID=2817061 RepID=A0ABS3JPT1_9BACT|nr:hypothetical protein [Fibrella forsythiae]MBO0952015.1 hypothetical protein [Fibrella forsythiae]
MAYITKSNFEGRGPLSRYRSIHLEYGCPRLWADYRDYQIPQEITQDPVKVESFNTLKTAKAEQWDLLSVTEVASDLSIDLRQHISPAFIKVIPNSGPEGIGDDLDPYLNQGYKLCNTCFRP